MKKKSKAHFPDIYIPPENQLNETEKTASETIKQQIRRKKIQTFILGWILIALILTIVGVVLYSIFDKPVSPPPLIKKKSTFSSYLLPTEDLWVLDYRHVGGQHNLLQTDVKRPLSTKWIKNVAYNLIIGRLALDCSDYPTSIYHLKKALIAFPELKDVQGPLGTAYLQKGQWEPAIQHLEQAVQLDPSIENISNLGIALLGAKRLEEAKNYLLQAAQHFPDHPGCHKNLAILYSQQNDPKKAISHFKTYFSLHTEDINTIETFSRYLSELSRSDEAIAFLNERTRLEKTHKDQIYLILAELQAKKTNAKQATIALKKACEYSDPKIILIQTRQPSFDKIRETEIFKNFIYWLKLATLIPKK